MTHPVVKIGGKEYPVPPLVVRQNRVVTPALIRLKEVSGDLSKLTSASYDDMMQIIFWGAIWPNDKTAQQTCLLDEVIPFHTIPSIISVIRQQAGLFSETSGEEQSGEAIPQ